MRGRSGCLTRTLSVHLKKHGMGGVDGGVSGRDDPERNR
jgi:hypothetical protein